MKTLKSTKPVRQASDYIYTHTGRALYPEEMTIDDICLEDIAYGLGNIKRFNGQSAVSVLRHSVAVGLHFPDGSAERLWGFLHDAAEAYMMDVPKPLQRLVGDKWKRVYTDIEALIMEKFMLGVYFDHDMVRDEDRYVVEYEMDIGLRRSNSRMVWPLPRKLTPDNFRHLDTRYSWHMSEEELGYWFIRSVQTLSASLRGGSARQATSLEALERQAHEGVALEASIQATPLYRQLNGHPKT